MIEGTVLPEDAGGFLDQDVDLLAGLEIRRPDWVRSGAFIDAAGRVLTLAQGLDGCARIAIGADILASAAPLPNFGDVAILEPAENTAPLDYANFAQGSGRIGGPISAA